MVARKMNLSWIVVSDLEQAIKYYTEVIGLKVREKNQEYGWVELVGEDGGGALGIAQANEQMGMKPGVNAVVTFSVNDIEKSIEELMDRGVKLIGEVIEVPNEVKMQTFIDADGNTFQIVEELSNR